MKLNFSNLRVLLFSWTFFVLLYRFWSGLLVHQWGFPMHFDPYFDVAMWGLIISNIPRFIMDNFYVSLLFDFILFGLVLLNIIKHKRKYAIAFSLFFLTYAMMFNMVSIGHGHNLFAIFVISILFWFKDPPKIAFAWHALRYYILFVYFSAFVWKALRISMWDIDYGLIVLKLNNYETVFRQVNTLSIYLLDHTILSYIIIISGVILEAFFIVGYFTFKFDKILFWFVILFHLATYFLMNLHFFPFLIVSLAFVPISIKGKDSLTYIFNDKTKKDLIN